MFYMMISFLISQFSFSAPLLLQGDYFFKEQVIAQMRKRVEIVDTRRPGAQERIDQLVRNGAACEVPRLQSVRCLLLLPAQAVPTNVLAQVVKLNKGTFFQFMSPQADPRIVRQGDVLIEWEINQAYRSRLAVGSGLRWFELRGELNKIALRFPNETLWLTVLSDRLLVLSQTIISRESPHVWFEDLVDVVYSR